MQDISLHILDVAENALRARARQVHLSVIDDPEKDRFTVCIRDDGKGMTGEEKRRATDPFYTTKSGKRVGLGLSLLAQAAEQTGGCFSINSSPDGGTEIRAQFVPSHPDMKPMGDIQETLETLIVANPDVRFTYRYRDGAGAEQVFDSQQVS